jgi:hypothetical protein
MAFLPGGPNRIDREIPALLLFFFFFCFCCSCAASSRGAEISLIAIRAELMASVEKSPSSTKGVRGKRAGESCRALRDKLTRAILHRTRMPEGIHRALAQICRSQA